MAQRQYFARKSQIPTLSIACSVKAGRRSFSESLLLTTCCSNTIEVSRSSTALVSGCVSPQAKHCRRTWVKNGKRNLAFRFSTESARQKCCICSCRIMKTTYATEAAENCWLAMRLSYEMNKANRHNETRGISGSKGPVPRWVTGNGQKKRNEHLFTAGSAPAIYIAATIRGSGFTWAAATIASSRADNGYHQ